jgi:hypothetical protein
MRERRLLHNGRVVGVKLLACETFLDRARGLLRDRHALRPPILKITPCAAIHTCGLLQPIDVVFTRRDGMVLRCVHSLPPWRAVVCRRSHVAWELPRGLCRRLAIHPGDHLDDLPPAA